MKRKYKIGFFGDDKWAHNALKLLIIDKTIKINFICGRFSKRDTKLLQIARKNNIKFYRKKNVNDNKFISLIKKEKLDLIVSMSYNQIFQKKIINSVKGKIINCHAGKLPFYRGRNILNWVLINGEKEFGITTHFVDEKIDQGKIIIQKMFNITQKDDYKSLLSKAYKNCALVLYESIKKIQNNNYYAIPQNQISKKFFYYFKRKKGDEIINLKKKSYEIENFVKALVEPGPLARINLKKNQIYVKRVSILNKRNYEKIKNKKILQVKNKKIYIPTIDKKTICIEKWYLKNKIEPGLLLELL